jgi:hypothetical protein
MADPEEPKPRTLKLQKKKYPAWVIVLGIVIILASIAFAVYTIYQATLPPDI